MFKRLRSIILAALVLFCFVIKSHAYTEVQNGAFTGGANGRSFFLYGELGLGNSRTSISSLHYSNILGNNIDYKVVNYYQVITLDYSRASKSDVGGTWQVTVTYKVTNLISGLYDIQTLTVSDKNYQDVKAHSFSSPSWKIEILSKSVTGSLSAYVIDDIKLLPSTQIEYYRSFSSAVTYTSTPVAIDASTDELLLKWNALPAVEEYEIQYVFIDKQDLYYSNIESNPSYAFDHFNPTSSTITHDIHYKEPVNVLMKPLSGPIQEFRIHATYNDGLFLYRVRPLSRMFDNYEVVKYGPWPATVPFYEITEEFESNKFWSSVTTFAEEGKHKEVMSYLDGSMRPRQTITNLADGSNAAFQNYTVIAETKYDYEGKAVLNTLPALLPQNQIHYQPLLNKSNSTDEFGKDNYDKISHSPSDPLSITSGAGAYYSSNAISVFQDWPMMKYIPDAFGYAYSQVEYVRDGTGRVRSTGGVGADHQVGSGKDTRYFYGTATESQLRRLFGKNVGNAKHYKKNYVVDPNGQVSVAYLDQEERTVATALAGEAPANVIGLASNVVQMVTDNLMAANTVYPDRKLSYLTHTIVNLVPNTTYDFSYSVKGVINKLDEYVINMCDTCEYDLKVYITDDWGNYIDLTPTGGSAVDSIFMHIGGQGIISNCETVLNYYTTDAVTFSSTLPAVGEYKLVKELTMSNGSIEAFAQWLSENYTNWPNREELIEDYLAQVDTGICDLSCAGAYKSLCLTELKASTEFVWNDLSTAEQDERLKQCIADKCSGKVSTALSAAASAECASMLEQMKRSIVPNVDGSVNYNWWAGAVFADLVLTDPNNTIATITVTQSDLADSVLLEEWIVDTLVYYHREYCHYVNCINRLNADTFEARLAMQQSFEEARSGYIDYVKVATAYVSGLTHAIENDPFFKFGGAGYSFRADMEADLLHYKTNPVTGGRNIYDYYAFTNAYSPYQDNVGNSLAITNDSVFYPGLRWPQDSDRIKLQHWRFIRSSYLALRNEYIAQAEQADGCLFLGDSFAIVKNPTGNLPDNDEDLNAVISQTLSQDAGSTCLGNLNAWRLILTNECYITDSFFNQYLYNHLLNYCTRHYGPSNPLGLLFREDIPTDPDLAEVHSILNGCDTNITVYNPYAYTADSLYYYNDSTYGMGQNPIVAYHTPLVRKYCFVKPCVYNMFNVVNDLTAETNNHWANCGVDTVNFANDCFGTDSSTIYMPDRDTGSCYFFVGRVEGNGCAFALYFVDSNGNKINYINRVENLQMDSTPSVLGFLYSSSESLHIHSQGNISDPATCMYTYITATLDLGPLGKRKGWLYRYVYEKCFASMVQCVTDTVALGFKDSSQAVQNLNMSGYYDTCLAMLREQATYMANQKYEEEYEATSGSLMLSLNKCFADPFAETFTVTYPLSEYHYTLYYYDQGGNLVQTVPPAGFSNDSVSVSSLGVWNGYTPHHRLRTRYRHNSLNAVRWQVTPDTQDSSSFYYDSKGMLKVSQNGKQRPLNQYSFTNYDELGRIINVGQVESPAAVHVYRGMLDLPNYLARFQPTTYPEVLTKITDFTFTQYDLALSSFNTNGRGRVTSAYRFGNMFDFVSYLFGNASTYTSTNYAYDVHGNVKAVKQKLPYMFAGLTFETNYAYDLLSGKVNKVNYYVGSALTFSHRYTYDADNKLRKVETSHGGWIWENDATYYYYPHGPLMRTELGHDGVQGLDYYYTIHGWLKGINDVGGNESDPGLDGYNRLVTYASGLRSSLHPRFARDEFALMLGYYEGDYTPVGSSVPTLTPGSAWSNYSTDLQPELNTKYGLFNGNIALMATRIAPNLKVDGSHPFASPMQTMAYKYDQLNRIKTSVAYDATNGTAQSGSNAYREQFTYDPNGNITNLLRYDRTAELDNLTYKYDKESNGSGNYFVSNRLYHFDDATPTTANGDDLEDPGTFTSSNSTVNSNNIFSYDATGNLIKDESEDIDEIKWDAYGKITEIIRNSASIRPSLAFAYDAMGNRVLKVEKTRDIDGNVEPYTNWNYTWYARDAGGNIMGTVVKPGAGNYQQEISIYGSSRIGVYKPQYPDGYALGDDYRLMGLKTYELTNHLGNVLATVSDKKRGVDEIRTNNLGAFIAIAPDGKAEYYLADVTSAQDYYPFGSIMPGRSFSTDEYRYGFNGQEKDDEVSGSGNTMTAEFWEYDSRLGRRWNTDPVTKVWESPYACFDNNPILFSDVLGNSGEDATTANKKIIAANNLVTPLFDPKHNRKDIGQGIQDAAVKFAQTDQGKELIKTAGDLKDFIDLSRSIWSGQFAASAVSEKNYGDWSKAINSAGSDDLKAALIYARNEININKVEFFDFMVKEVIQLPLLASSASILGNFYNGTRAVASIASNEESSGDVLYRVIRQDESLSQSIVAKNPNATYTVEGHVLNGSRISTQYVSTTRSIQVAIKWAQQSGNRIIVIDPSKIQGEIIDLTNPAVRNALLRGNTARNFATSSQEVLIKGQIPTSAFYKLPGF